MIISFFFQFSDKTQQYEKGESKYMNKMNPIQLDAIEKLISYSGLDSRKAQDYLESKFHTCFRLLTWQKKLT